MEPVAHDDEREALRAQFEQEHEEAQRRFEERRAAGRDRAEAHRERKVRGKRLELEAVERKRFYKEHGYKRYVDSRGQEHWLLPEEYAWRQKAREARNRRNRKYRNMSSGRYNQLLLMGLAVLLAVALGLVLLR